MKETIGIGKRGSLVGDIIEIELAVDAYKRAL